MNKKRRMLSVFFCVDDEPSVIMHGNTQMMGSKLRIKQKRI